MKNRTILKYLLYILSLWLLFVSLFVMSFDKKLFTSFFDNSFILFLKAMTPKNIVFAFSLFFIIVGVFILGYLSSSFNAGWSVSCSVSNVTNESHEHLEFLTTYVMPLVFTDVNSKRTMLNLLIMIVAIGMIYVRTDRFYSNPSLALLGFKIYKGKIIDRGEKNFVIICKGDLKDGSAIKYIRIDDNTCFVKII